MQHKNAEYLFMPYDNWWNNHHKKTKLDINPTLTLARIQILSTRDRIFDKFIPTVFASPSFWFC